MLNFKKIFLLQWFLFLTNSLVFSQAIINTETLMDEIDSTFFIVSNIEGDIKYGNIDLFQFNGNILAAKKYKNHLIRGFINYEYLSEDKSILASDISSQIRYNFILDKHSLFAFCQIQNAVSLRLNERLVSGVGFRQSILKATEKSNYLDVAYGSFYEKETYQRFSDSLLSIHNIRLSLASYSQLNIGKKNRIMTVIYYQLNAFNYDDYRIYFEPRFYTDFKKISLYLNGLYRYHSTPYVNINNFDSQLTFGIEFKF